MAEVAREGLLIGLDNYMLDRVADLHTVYPSENLTLAAWLISEPNWNVRYKRG